MSKWEERVVTALVDGPWPLFAARVRALRRRFMRRRWSAPHMLCSLVDTPPGAVEAEGVATVCLLMQTRGYTITESELLDIESGTELPPEPPTFIEAFVTALELDEDAEASLNLALLYDIGNLLLTQRVVLSAMLYLVEEGLP